MDCPYRHSLLFGRLAKEERQHVLATTLKYLSSTANINLSTTRWRRRHHSWSQNAVPHDPNWTHSNRLWAHRSPLPKFGTYTILYPSIVNPLSKGFQNVRSLIIFNFMSSGFLFHHFSCYARLWISRHGIESLAHHMFLQVLDSLESEKDFSIFMLCFITSVKILS